MFNSPEDSEYEVACTTIGVAELDVYPSIWGHWAGGPPGNQDDVRWLDERLAKIFAEAPVKEVSQGEVEDVSKKLQDTKIV